MIVESNAGAPFGLRVVPRSEKRIRINLDVKITDRSRPWGRRPILPGCSAPRQRARPRVERVSTSPDSAVEPAPAAAPAPALEPSTARHLHHLLATEQRSNRLPSVAAG